MADQRSPLRDYFEPSEGTYYDPNPSTPPPTAGEMFNLEVSPEADFRRGLRSTNQGLYAGELFRQADQYQVDTQDAAGAERIREQARQVEADAALTAPRVGSFQDVQGVGDAVDYLQSGMGQLLPTMGPPMAAGLAGAIGGAAVAGPLGIGPGIAAGLGGAAAASVPAFQMEAGEQASSQQADPWIRENTTAEQRLREQNIKGAQNAALESLFPAVFGGRVVGGAARRIAGEALKNSPLRRTLAVARETGIESGTELSQTLTGQASLSRLNPNRDTTHDYIEQIDSIILGALGGSSVSLGTTVPGYAMEKLGQRAEQKADVALRDLGRAGAELQLRTITQMQQRGQAVGLDVPLRPSLMTNAQLEEKDRAEFQELARRYQQALTAGDDEQVQKVVLETEKFFYNKHPEWKIIQEGIMSREAINTGGGTNTLRLGPEGTPTQENPDINMLPDQPVAMFPESTEGAAKFTRQHVRRGEERRQLMQWKRQGFIPEEGIDAAQETPLGQWLEKRRAAPEEVQAEVASMIRDIDRRLRSAKEGQVQQLQAEKEALQQAKTYGDYYKALDNYTVLEFPADVVQGRFTPQDAAQQQRSSELMTSKQERDQLNDEQGIRLQLKIGGQPRWVYRDDVIKHARNFFREELRAFPDGPARDEAALLMGVFADPRVKNVSIRNEDGTYTRITQDTANLEDPRHRAALKLDPPKRGYKFGKRPQDPAYSLESAERGPYVSYGEYTDEQGRRRTSAAVFDERSPQESAEDLYERRDEIEEMEMQRRRAEERLAEARPNSPQARQAKMQLNRLNRALTRYFDEFGGALRDQTRFPVTEENPIIEPAPQNVSRETLKPPRRPKAPPVVGESAPKEELKAFRDEIKKVVGVVKLQEMYDKELLSGGSRAKADIIQAEIDYRTGRKAPQPTTNEARTEAAPTVNIASPFRGRGNAQIRRGVKQSDVRLAAGLTNVTFTKYPVDNVPGLKKPTAGKSAEHWYQANKTGDLAADKAMMQQVIEAKLKQHPNLIQGITDRGGVSWIENSEHTVTGNPRWEGKGRESNFLDALANAYEAVVSRETPQTNVPRETSNEAWRKGLPEHTIDPNLSNKDGSKRLASVRDGKPVIRPVATVQEFFDYFLGNVEGPTSKQKMKVLGALVREGWPLSKVRRVVNTADKANQFLVLHEQSHLDNKDIGRYFAWEDEVTQVTGTRPEVNYLTPDKIAIEVRATKDALEQMVANDGIKASRQTRDELANDIIYARLARNLKEKGYELVQDPETEEYMILDKDGNRVENEETKAALNDIPLDMRFESLEEALQDPDIQTRKEAATRWLIRAFGPEIVDRLGWMLAREAPGLPMAGFYDTTRDFIQLAVDSIDPLSISFHEGMHKFVKTLRDSGGQELYDRLVKAATAPHVMKQMERMLADYPMAIEQMKADPEEAVAYAFQFYAASRLPGGPEFRLQNKNLFKRVVDTIAKMLGIMTHARASQEIFDALYEGRVARDGMEPLRKYQERSFKEYTGDVMKALKSSVPRIVSSPIIQLQQMTNARGQQIQAFKKLANYWHSEPRKGGEAGLLQRNMQLEGQYRNRWHKILQDHNATKEDLKAALQNFQAWRDPRNALERDIQTFFNAMYAYQFLRGENPVKVLKVVDEETGDMEWVTPDRVRNYFPRIWSVENILANEIEFREVMREEGELTDEQINNFIEMLQATNGTEAGSELQQYRADFSPYNAAINARVFDFINEANAHKFAKFQEQDMGKIMDRYIRQAVHRREHSRTFGHDGKVIKEIFKQAQREGATPEQIAYAEKVVKGMEGRLGTDKVSDLARELMVGSMSLVNFAVLPLALFSSMVDPLGVLVRTDSMEATLQTFKAGFKQILNDARKVKTPDQELTEYLGIIEEDMVQDILNNLERGMYMNEKLRRWNKFFFKSIGLEQWTRGTRIGAMRASLEYLKRNSDNAEALAELGLEPGMIQEYEDRIALKPGEFQDGDQTEQARKVQNAVYRMVDEAILRPSAGTRPLWMSDMRFRLFGHLKSYTFTFHNQILRQVGKRVKDADDMGKAALAIMPLLAYVPVMLAADMARDMVKGDDRDRDWDEVLGRALQRSAILGMGTFLMDIEDDMDYGGLPTNTLLGPVVDNALNIGRAAANPDASLVKAGAKLLPYYALLRDRVGDE